MDTLMGTLAIYALMALVVTIALYITFMMWRRALGDDRPLLLGEMLGRLGASLPDAATGGLGYDYAFAVRRCVNCGEADTCRKWLETGKQVGYAEFCPNAGFIERLNKSSLG
jgi:hypothetical protein